MDRKFNKGNIEFSYELDEIISKPPSWMVKRGIFFIFLILLIITGVAFFLKYPRIVYVDLKFNSSNPPIVLKSNIKGRISRILIKEGEFVSKNTDIAYLESLADHAEVLQIRKLLQSIKDGQVNKDKIESIFARQNSDLGELQQSFENLNKAYLLFKAIQKKGILQERLKFLSNEMSNVDLLRKQIEESRELQKLELRISEEELSKMKLLEERKVISHSELKKYEGTLLSKKQLLPQTESNLINNSNTYLMKLKEKSEIENQMLEQGKLFYQTLNSFINDIEVWKNKYVISSYSDGYLVYGEFLNSNQAINIDENLFYIYQDKGDFYGEMYIPQEQISRVKVSQKVLIKVKSFPYKEYGQLKGKIEYISSIPLKDSAVFSSRVKLERSDLDSLISLKPGLIADAEIITQEESFFNKIWRQQLN